MKTAFLFPGQGSQQVGMGKALADANEAARRVFEEADHALGFSISRLCFEGPAEELSLTTNQQPAVLTTSIAAFRALSDQGIRPDFVAGHSLGEYSALVAAGGLQFKDAVKIVRSRGQFMQEAVPAGEGAMAAFVGSDLATAEEICREASELGVCSPANINAPNQIVVAGNKAAVDRAAALAKEKGVRKVVMLQVSAPFHCELMKPAADRLQPLLDQTEFNDLAVPLVNNADAKVITERVAARDGLIRQVASPVRWTDTVRLLLDEGVTQFIELGSGKVLSGLVRQVTKEVETLNVEDAESLERTVGAVRL